MFKVSPWKAGTWEGTLVLMSKQLGSKVNIKINKESATKGKVMAF